MQQCSMAKSHILLALQTCRCWLQDHPQYLGAMQGTVVLIKMEKDASRIKLKEGAIAAPRDAAMCAAVLRVAVRESTALDHRSGAGGC